MALLAATPARAAELLRLDRLGTVRFTAADNGKLRRQEGILHRDGRFNPRPAIEVERPANTPAWALGRDLIALPAWTAYRALGFGATDNYTLFGGAWFYLGDEKYYLVGPDPEAESAAGRLINISTRARLNTAADTVIAGFVIEDQPRLVLVRAVGPGLATFGVISPLADPKLIVRRGAELVQSNDNWSAAVEADVIREVTPLLGAFALDANSNDAAALILLEPGAYTVEVAAARAGLSGDVLIEVYSVPDNVVSLPE